MANSIICIRWNAKTYKSLTICVFVVAVRMMFLAKLVTKARQMGHWLLVAAIISTLIEILVYIHACYLCVSKDFIATPPVADALLILQGLFTPLFNVWRVILFDARDDFVIFSCLVCFLYPGLLDQPGPHALLGWLAGTPVYVVLGYFKVSQSSSHQCFDSQYSWSNCFSPFVSYLAVQGSKVVVFSFVASLISFSLSLQSRLKSSALQEREKAGAIRNESGTEIILSEVSPVPFESLTWLRLPGFKAFSVAIDGISPWLSSSTCAYLMSWLYKLTMLISTGYFVTLALAIRFGMFSRTSFTSEDMLLGILTSSLLSREFSQVDMTSVMALFDHLSNRYIKSREVLRDMLPEHVVDSLIRTQSSMNIEQLRENNFVLDTIYESSTALPVEPPLEAPLPALSLLTNRHISLSLSQALPNHEQLSPSPSISQLSPTPSLAHVHAKSRRRSLMMNRATSSHSASVVSSIFSRHDCCTIFFSDLVGFSTWAHKVEPEVIMATLHDLYSRLDRIILEEMPMIYKIETIGDAYVVAANLIDPDPMHAVHAIRFALRAQEEASKVPRPDCHNGECLQMRIGIHSGSVASGVIGQIRKRFCLFGDAVNMTARTESSCPPGCVQLTEACYNEAEAYLDSEDIQISDRGLVQVKGSTEPLRMYLAAWTGAEATCDLTISEILQLNESITNSYNEYLI